MTFQYYGKGLPEKLLTASLSRPHTSSVSSPHDRVPMSTLSPYLPKFKTGLVVTAQEYLRCINLFELFLF